MSGMMTNIDSSYWMSIVVAITLKVLGAIVVWVVGRWLINLAMRLLSAALTRQHVEPTLIRYLLSFLTIALNVVLVVAILGYFGLETTSFAAFIAAAGIAIGAAWAGLLSNFAAGAFLLMFRPFKVGDYILAGGVEGTVEEIGLFVTTINTPDNVLTIVGNGKIFADNVKNYSANPYRRVELAAQLAHSVDPVTAISQLKVALARHSERADDAGARCRDSHVQRTRPGSGSAALLRQCPLLAGLFRHEQSHPQHLCKQRLSGPRSAYRATGRLTLFRPTD